MSLQRGLSGDLFPNSNHRPDEEMLACTRPWCQQAGGTLPAPRCPPTSPCPLLAMDP